MNKQQPERKVDNVINEYKSSLTTTTRSRYPKIELHDVFIRVLDKQIKLLKKQGLSDKIIKDRLQRVIPFHIYDDQEKH